MTCPKCGSQNVNVSVIDEMQLKDKHHGCLWWVCIGWWWLMVKWLVFTLPALIVAIFKPKKQKLVNKQKTMYACQNCGHTWKA